MYNILIFPFLMNIYHIYITRNIINKNNKLIQLKFDEYNKKINN
jgi:hypothetical protein